LVHLEGLLANHRRRPPLVPAPALPAQAPSGTKLLARFYFGRPGAPVWRKLTPALITVVGLWCLAGVLLSPQADRHSPAAQTTTAQAITQAVAPSPTPSPFLTVEAPPTTQAAPPPPAPTKPTTVNLCGAPQNPWNYTFCSGSNITEPPDDFCSYFACIDNFWNGRGYVIQCNDNMFSKSGGIQGSCSYHKGNKRPLRQKG